MAAERYLYLPSVALALAAGGFAAGAKAFRHRRALTAAFGALLVVCGASCWRTTAIWASPVGLWRYVTSQPEGARHMSPWVNLGQAITGSRGFDATRAALAEVTAAGRHADDRGLASALSAWCFLESEQGWSLLDGRDLGRAVERFSAARGICARAAAFDAYASESELHGGLAGMGEFLAREAMGGAGDPAALAQACAGIGKASAMRPGDDWAARQVTRCRRLQERGLAEAAAGTR